MRYQLSIAEVGTSLSIFLELLSFILFLVENCLDKWDHHRGSVHRFLLI